MERISEKLHGRLAKKFREMEEKAPWPKPVDAFSAAGYDSGVTTQILNDYIFPALEIATKMEFECTLGRNVDDADTELRDMDCLYCQNQLFKQHINAYLDGLLLKYQVYGGIAKTTTLGKWFPWDKHGNKERRKICRKLQKQIRNDFHTAGNQGFQRGFTKLGKELFPNCIFAKHR